MDAQQPTDPAEQARLKLTPLIRVDLEGGPEAHDHLLHEGLDHSLYRLTPPTTS